jgi:hypothetical protein
VTGTIGPISGLEEAAGNSLVLRPVPAHLAPPARARLVGLFHNLPPIEEPANRPEGPNKKSRQGRMPNLESEANLFASSRHCQ